MGNQTMQATTKRTGLGDTAPIGLQIYEIGKDNQIILTSANSAADILLGIDHAKLIGSPIDDVFPQIRRSGLLDTLREVAREGTSWQGSRRDFDPGSTNTRLEIQAIQTSPGKIGLTFQDSGNRTSSSLPAGRSEAILAGVAQGAEVLLQNSSWKENLVAVLEPVGKGANFSRVFIGNNKYFSSTNFVCNQIQDWRHPDLPAKLGHPWMLDFSFQLPGFSEWADLLQSGEVIHCAIREQSEEIKLVFAHRNILTLTLAPIFVDQDWWGVIGFEECLFESRLVTKEIQALGTFAKTIGAAIQRSQAELLSREYSARAQALIKTVARINTDLKPEAVVNTVCMEAVNVLDAKASMIYLYDEEIRSLHCVGGYNLPQKDIQFLKPIPIETLNTYLDSEGNPFSLQGAEAILSLYNAPLHEVFGSWNILTRAIFHEQRFIGILSVLLKEDERNMTVDELAYLEGLTHEAALAINNARILFIEQTRSRELSTLYELSINLNNSQTVDKALEVTLESVQKLVDSDAGLAVLRNDRKSTLSIPKANGYLSQNAGSQISLRENWDLFLDDTQAPNPAKDLAENPGLFININGINKNRPGTLVPLYSTNEPIGLILALQSRDPGVRMFTPVDLRLLRTIGELAGTTVHKAQYYEDAQRRLTFLQSLRSIDIEIASSLDLEKTLNVVLEEVLSQLHVDAADILLMNPETGVLEYVTGLGFQDENLVHRFLARGESYAALAAVEQRLFILPDIRGKQTNFSISKLFKQERFLSYVAAPLFSKGLIKGVLEIYNRQPLEMDQEWLEFLETLAGQAAIAIDNTNLFNNLQHSNTELIKAYDTTIEGWSIALDLKDTETEGHTQRVADMTVRLAQRMGIRDEDLVHVRRGAMLHDIGKMGVPDSILRKPGPLNDQEWEVMRKHPVYAYEWLSPTDYLLPSLDIPYCHHEKWDGSGYPQGLKSADIPLTARIFSVVDVWDALSSDRPYRKAWPDDRVVDYLREQVNAYFDPKVVPVFLDLLHEADLIF